MELIELIELIAQELKDLSAKDTLRIIKGLDNLNEVTKDTIAERWMQLNNIKVNKAII